MLIRRLSIGASQGHYGIQRTFVPWEPVQSDGTCGVEVKKEHAWLYIFDAGAVHQIKQELAKDKAESAASSNSNGSSSISTDSASSTKL